MKRNILQYLVVFLCLCGTTKSSTQTPKPDLDSITEDSYRRMLERQAAEQESDSLVVDGIQPIVREQKSTEWQRWYYAISVFIIIVALLLYKNRKQVF